MNPKNEWLLNEIQNIKNDIAHPIKNQDTFMMLKLMLLLLPLLYLGITLEANPKRYSPNAYHMSGDGIHFRCTHCGKTQWQSKNKADWQGNYYCIGCGTKAPK